MLALFQESCQTPELNRIPDPLSDLLKHRLQAVFFVSSSFTYLLIVWPDYGRLCE